ncbi:MAG: hypothetical protein IJT26_00970 [Bacteroidales bacterium]|nr:hypothetical protein [Bacteroidales bacterium]
MHAAEELSFAACVVSAINYTIEKVLKNLEVKGGDGFKEILYNAAQCLTFV